jgi:nicotinamide mononucleotide adenylyltransferase
LLKRIALEITPRIVVGIITNPPYRGHARRTKLQREADIRNDSSRNPFTFWERCLMIRRTIEVEMPDSEIHILPFPRPDLFWEIVKGFLPPERTWVVPFTDTFDEEKVRFYDEMGEHVLRVRQKVRVHATDIRTRILDGEEWTSMIPGPALEVLESIDGISRLRKSSE